MIAYKLVREMKDGSLAPLFINKRFRFEEGVWLDAEFHPTNGYAERKGWHCTLEPHAPHLSTRGRVWIKVELSDYEFCNRPESQGGTWVLAQKLRFINKI